MQDECPASTAITVSRDVTFKIEGVRLFAFWLRHPSSGMLSQSHLLDYIFITFPVISYW